MFFGGDDDHDFLSPDGSYVVPWIVISSDYFGKIDDRQLFCLHIRNDKDSGCVVQDLPVKSKKPTFRSRSSLILKTHMQLIYEAFFYISVLNLVHCLGRTNRCHKEEMRH